MPHCAGGRIFFGLITVRTVSCGVRNIVHVYHQHNDNKKKTIPSLPQPQILFTR
jgi:hypothetical protein